MENQYQNNMFPACGGEQADGFKALSFFAKNFIRIEGPDNTKIRVPDKVVNELAWQEHMSKTHYMKSLKLRGGGTKIIWIEKK